MKSHYKIVSILIYSLFFIDAFPQTPNWSWVNRFGGSGFDSGISINADKMGNNYICGLFSDTIIFGNTQLITSGNPDMFFAKADSNGNIKWAFQFGGVDYDYGIEIIPDDFGNCYLIGTFLDTLYIGVDTLVSKGGKDMMIAKLDTNLNIVWVRRGGGSQTDDPYSIKIDKWGNIYAAIIFQGTAYFGSDSLVSAGGYDIALLKYDNNGNLRWATGAGGNAGDGPNSLSIDKDGNVLLGGVFSTTCTFGSNAVISAGDYDIFIAKYDTSGTNLWVKSFGSNGFDGNTVVRYGNDNCIYVSGGFSNAISFGNIPLSGIGVYDIFVAKCDSDANVIWAKQAGSTALDILTNMAIDDNDNTYLTGYYGGNASFGGINVSGNYDIFIAKYDSAGVASWVKTANGPGGQQSQRGWGVTASNGSIYVTGDFENNLSFDNSTFNIFSAGDGDIYVSKISQEFTSVNENSLINNLISVSNSGNYLISITASNFTQSTLIVYDLTGRMIYHHPFNKNETFNVEKLKAGMYIAEVRDEEGRKLQAKFVKN